MSRLFRFSLIILITSFVFLPAFSQEEKPAKVKVVDVKIEEVKFGSKTTDKVVLAVKHPDREETVAMSKAKVLKKDKVVTSGIWFVQDSDGNIQKGSTLAEVLIYAAIEKPSQLKDKEFDTVPDEDGYLILKCY